MCTISPHPLSLNVLLQPLFTQVAFSGIHVIFHRTLKLATRILCAVRMQAHKTEKNTRCPTHSNAYRFTVRSESDALWGGRVAMDDWVPHVFTSHRHNDNTTSDNTRRRPFVRRELIYREGVTRFEKIGKQCSLEGFLGAWVLLESCANADECEWKIAVWSCHVASVKNAWFFFPSLPPLAVIFIICPSKPAFFPLSLSPLLIISVLTLYSLTNIPSSISVFLLSLVLTLLLLCSSSLAVVVI